LRVSLELYARDAGKAVARGDVVVVIDVLRASSSIIVALARGAECVVPVRTIKEAREIANRYSELILAGERKGVRPPGFDYGNSPVSFSRLDLGGKRLILTTTSGTTAISRSRGAKHVLVGAFLNASSVAKSSFSLAEEENCGVTLSLAGKRGGFSLEDFLGAGAIANYFPEDVFLSDAAQATLHAYCGAECSLLNVVKRGNHGKYLTSIGFEEDVELCAQLNKYSIVPCLRNDVIIKLC